MIYKSLTAEAVSRRAEGGDTLSLERVDDLVERGAGELLGMGGEPLHDIVVAAGVERIGWDGVTIQVIRNVGLAIIIASSFVSSSDGIAEGQITHLESIRGKVIGKELWET